MTCLSSEYDSMTDISELWHRHDSQVMSHSWPHLLCWWLLLIFRHIVTHCNNTPHPPGPAIVANLGHGQGHMGHNIYLQIVTFDSLWFHKKSFRSLSTFFLSISQYFLNVWNVNVESQYRAQWYITLHYTCVQCHEGEDRRGTPEPGWQLGPDTRTAHISRHESQEEVSASEECLRGWQDHCQGGGHGHCQGGGRAHAEAGGRQGDAG